MQQIIAIDLDDTTWEFNEPILARYNKKYDDTLMFDELTDWDVTKFIKPECKNYFKEFVTEDLFKNDIIIDDDVVRKLTTLNDKADIFFVTAAISKTLPWRYEKLKQYLPWVKDEQLIKLKNKNLFKCDVLIDDNADNCMYCHSVSYLINKPWNKNISVNERTCKRVNRITEAIDDILEALP